MKKALQMTPEVSLLSWASLMRGQPFVWGQTDCVMLTLMAMDRFFWTDHAKDYAGRWGAEGEALAYFEKESPSSFFAQRGAAIVDSSYAVVGDVITVPASPWPEQCHFILGRFSLAADQTKGVILIPTRLLLRQPGATVWRLAQCLKQSH